MDLLRQLNRDVVEMFSRLSSLYPSSGWDVAEELQRSTAFTQKDFSIFYSCDLGDAYSNCCLSDLIAAVTFLYGLSDKSDNSWKLDLVIRLASFVFNNVFVEAGGSIWRCGSRLPMGCVASGEALDCICLAGEVVSLCGETGDVGTRVPSYLRNIGQITVDSYCRFRDDTKIVDSSDSLEEIILNLRNVACGIFPPQVPVSFEVSAFLGSFLDCVFFKNVSSNSYSTCVRMNLTSSSKWPDASSCTTPSYLTSSFLTNVIRAYRITNEEKLFEKYISFLQMEMRSAKHSEDVIAKVTRKARVHIQKNISSETLRSIMVRNPDRKFCRPTMFSPISRSDSILIKVLAEAYKASGQEDVSCLPSRRVGRKLQNIVFTKKSHKIVMKKIADV